MLLDYGLGRGNSIGEDVLFKKTKKTYFQIEAEVLFKPTEHKLGNSQFQRTAETGCSHSGPTAQQTVDQLHLSYLSAAPDNLLDDETLALHPGDILAWRQHLAAG